MEVVVEGSDEEVHDRDEFGIGQLIGRGKTGQLGLAIEQSIEKGFMFFMRYNLKVPLAQKRFDFWEELDFFEVVVGFHRLRRRVSERSLLVSTY